MKLQEYKARAKKLGITADYVKKFGRLTTTDTWIRAIAAKEKEQKDFEQLTASANEFTPYIEKLKGLKIKKEIEEATEEYVKFLRQALPNNKTFEPRISNLIKAINRAFPNYPDELSSHYKERKNFCAVTIAYEVRNELLSIKESPTEEPQKVDAPKPVVKLDSKKIIEFAESKLTSDNWAVLAGAVAFLTGRRPSEIFCISKFEVVNENQMTVTDIAKKKGEERTKFQFPVLGNADDILEAIEKIRTLKPMPDILNIYQEKGLSTAREYFNSQYSGGEYGYCKIFKDNFGHFQGEIKDFSFKSTRHFYASMQAWIYKKQAIPNGETSFTDAMKFAQECMAHESGETTLIYTDVEFENLPTVDKTYFENIGQKPVSDMILPLNVDAVMSAATFEEQVELKKLIQFGGTLENLFLDLYRKSKQQTPNQPRIIREKITASDKILWVIQAMINYNEKLLADKSQDENKKLYITITKASIDSMCKNILGSNQAPKTLTDCYERCLDAIIKVNEEWNKSGDSKIDEQRKNNLHIRPTRKDDSKMKIVISCISNEYNALQM